MPIRPATLADDSTVRSLYLAAFPEEEREAVATLAVDLLSEASVPETISLVAESAGLVVGHISFSPVSHAATDRFQGYLLAPLAVRPDFQKQRIGSSLIESGFHRLSKVGADIVFVYGDPQYYGRFGFVACATSEYAPPYQLQQPFGWQAKPLSDVGRFPPSGKLTCVPSLRDPRLW